MMYYSGTILWRPSVWTAGQPLKTVQRTAGQEMEKMSRAQCIVLRGNRILMVDDGGVGWTIPGGRIEEGESPAEAAIRELREECCVDGIIVRETGVVYAPEGNAHTFLVKIGEQEPQLGADPEFSSTDQDLSEVKWMILSEMPERDRAFVWAAGLIGVGEFLGEVDSWGNRISYPGSE